MFLLLLLTLQLGAAAVQQEGGQERPVIVTPIIVTPTQWVEVGNTSTDETNTRGRACFTQAIVMPTSTVDADPISEVVCHKKEMCAELRATFSSEDKAEFARKLGKSMDEMSTADWYSFYAQYPKEGKRGPVEVVKGVFLHKMGEESRSYVRKDLGKSPNDRAVGSGADGFGGKTVKATPAPSIAKNIYARFSLYVLDNSSSALVRRYNDARHELRRKRDAEHAVKQSPWFQEIELYKAAVKQAEADALACAKEAYQAEKEILCAIQHNDPDYCPGRATAEAQEFMQSWEDPGFRFCSARRLIIPFLDGLFSKLDPACKQQVWEFGGSVTAVGGFGEFLLELKYNAPVVALAIVQAILLKEAQAGADILSRKELDRVYASLSTGSAGVFLADDDTKIQAAHELGQSHAERVKSFVAKAGPAY